MKNLNSSFFIVLLMAGLFSVPSWSEEPDAIKKLNDYNEVLAKNPKDRGALLGRGSLYVTQEKFEEAFADFKTAAAADPLDPVPWVFMGNIRATQENFPEAIKHYDEAIRLNPNFQPAYGLRGIAWYKVKKEDNANAIVDFNKGIDLFRNDLDAHNGLAWLQATTPDKRYHNPSEAVRRAKIVLQLSQERKDPELPDHMATLAAAYAASGLFDKAVEWQTKANEAFEKNKDQKALGKGKERLALYLDKKPFIEK